jgi:7-cyano-7-deazaguanine synthase
MWLDKAQTWALAGTLGGQALIDIVVEHTHTCYLKASAAQRHAWGHGCGACPACELRAKGYGEYLDGKLMR